jgi:NAD(P)-dependent dehydrogenase (short-subunit alcohol dehydrogenase family)
MDAKRSVVITGSSSGIGEACVRRLATSGWRVIAGVHTEAGIARLVEQFPGHVEPVLLDVTEPRQIADLAARLGGAPLSALVNNAGVAVSLPVEFLPLAELRRQLEVNLVGHVAVTQALLPSLRRAHGRIVNVGSIAGKSALPFLGAYAASKHGIEAISDALRVELEPFGVQVTVVEPGTIATPIWAKGAENFQRIIGEIPAEITSLYGERMNAFRAAARAAGRRGAPADDVARVVEQALEAKHAPTRCVVGRDARRRALVERLPTRLRDRVYARVLLRA